VNKSRSKKSCYHYILWWISPERIDKECTWIDPRDTAVSSTVYPWQNLNPSTRLAAVRSSLHYLIMKSPDSHVGHCWAKPFQIRRLTDLTKAQWSNPSCGVWVHMSTERATAHHSHLSLVSDICPDHLDSRSCSDHFDSLGVSAYQWESGRRVGQKIYLKPSNCDYTTDSCGYSSKSRLLLLNWKFTKLNSCNNIVALKRIRVRLCGAITKKASINSIKIFISHIFV
jgi:hypothetical protein